MATSTAQSSTTSQALYETACTLMPGGVNSPVRAFGSVGGTPFFVDRAQGPYMWDADGNRYIDYVGSWGPMILGHAYGPVIERVQQLAVKGTSYGAPTALENELARLVIDAVPSIEMVRFVNSGTEAVMSALRLARAHTGRSKIIKFKGCYHGHCDALLVKAGSGAATHGTPDSAGVPSSVTETTLMADFNNIDSVKAIFDACGSEIAAVLVEPVAGNMGCIPPVQGFLSGLRELTQQHGAMLIFDEVMTGFRVHYGGAQTKYHVTPDITALGKIIGGGLPVGAYGASKDIMAKVAPLGPMYQAGTLSGNPLAMGAGIETLTALRDNPGWYDDLLTTTTELVMGLVERLEAKGISVQTHIVGSMFSVYFGSHPIRSYDDVAQCNGGLFKQYFHGLKDRGVYMAPSAFEAGFVSIAHNRQTTQETLDALADLSLTP